MLSLECDPHISEPTAFEESCAGSSVGEGASARGCAGTTGVPEKEGKFVPTSQQSQKLTSEGSES